MHALWLRLVFWLGTLGLVATSAAAQPDSLLRRFETANEAYAQGRYERAVEDYRAVLDAGMASGALYHNLGNAYVRLDRTGPAVWAYEKARQLRPEDPRLRHNLEFVRAQAGLTQVGLPLRGLTTLVGGWWPGLLFGLGVVALGGGLLVAALRDEADWWRAGGKVRVWGPVVAGGLLIGGALGGSYVQAQERRAVVMEDALSLRRIPALGAAADTTLQGGTMVRIRGRQEDWVRVQLPNRITGWAPAQALGTL